MPRARLGELGTELGRGGQGRVHLLPQLSLPDAPGPLVYKEYHARSAPPHGLSALVAKRNRLEPAERARLDARACWPLRVVEDGGSVTGVILPLIPDSFRQERVLPGTGRRTKGVREVQHLIVDPAMTRRLGMPCPSPAQRLVICRDLAAAVHLVHRLDLVVGDMNARNALYQLSGRPAVMLLDCDAFRIMGSASVVPQLNAPDWFPPEGPDALNQATDRYKIGLFVLRCLAPGKLSSIDRDPARADAALDVEGRALLRAALSHTPRERTTAQAWGRYFDRRATGRPPLPARVPGRIPTVASPQPRPSGGRRRDAVGQWQPVDD
jgi:hypothetical protein